MTLTDHQGFLDAIRAEPDNDDLRLIYADWLEDQGEECHLLHWFIREQVQHPVGGNPAPNYEWHKSITWQSHLLSNYVSVRRLPKEIQAKHKPPGSMIGTLSLIKGSAIVGEAFYHRGFIRDVTCTGNDWIAWADEILQWHPVENVTWTEPPDHFSGDLKKHIWLGDRNRKAVAYLTSGDHVPLMQITNHYKLKSLKHQRSHSLWSDV